MPVFSVEYLAIFRRTDSFCDSAGAFTRLLQVNSDIVVNNSKISYKKAETCDFQLSNGEVAGKGQRYFQLRFDWDGDPDVGAEDLERFLSLLRGVRTLISNTGGEVETLHDDVSAFYAQKAYPLIHDTENLMRRLIANFMLLNVGIEWTTEALPREVEDAVQKGRRKPSSEEQPQNEKSRDYLNVLHTLDFIHLGNILFDPYAKTTPADLYIQLKEVKSVAEVEALQHFIPKSNWSRYFAQIIKCDDIYLESRWKKLYLLRCKVAHNALMNKQDFADIERLIREVKPKLLEALGKLPKVTVPPSEVESVAESAARNTNAAVGEFIASWQQMEAAVARRLEAAGDERRAVNLTARELHERRILERLRMESYDNVRRLRNRIVHGPSRNVPMEEIQVATAEIRRLIECVEKEGFIARLRGMTVNERASEIDLLLSKSRNEITKSKEFLIEADKTEAFFFVVDAHSIDNIEVGADECSVTISYSASSEEATDGTPANRITGTADAIIDWQGRTSFKNITARLDLGEQAE